MRGSGLDGLARMWRRFSSYFYEANEKIDLCVSLWELRHWLQVSSMDNAIHAFRPSRSVPPGRPRFVGRPYRTRNNRGDLLRQWFNRLWEWCAKTSGGTRTLPTEVLLETSYLQYSMEMLEWTPATEDWSRELRVLDVEQP
ncbi:hypothetical protein PHMEG_00026475 [Phytophthora megakarya]|uniref:Uncharacterized protein n=1 Tax=Phytophthora megakarya TaxID=4795 RepID=A0A225V9I5_9STRA|nr:hypothetical protein PHMEG_00026475 [Phytophthora megakarya]